MSRIPIVLVVLLLMIAVWFLLRGGGDDFEVEPRQSDQTSQQSVGDAPALESLGEATREVQSAPPEDLSAGDGATTGAETLEVRVVSRVDGSPVAGALCRLAQVDDSPEPESTTDAGGMASFRIDEPGVELWLVVVCEGFLVEERDVAPDRRSITVALEPGLVVRGRVLEAAGRQPVAGAEIWATLDRDLRDLAFDCTTDQEGRFRLPGVPADSPFEIEVSVEGYVTASYEDSWSAPRAEVVILLRRGATVEGLVLDASGQSVAGADVAVRRTDDDYIVADAVTDRDGAFRIVGLDVPAVILIEARSEHGTYGATEPIELSRDRSLVRADIYFGVSSTSLAVRIEQPDGEPVPDVSLQIRDDQGDEPRAPFGDHRLNPWEFRREDGWHVFGPLRPGSYGLSVRPIGWPPCEVGVEVLESVRNEVTVTLDGGAELTGTVVSPTGEPIADAEVEFGYPGAERARSFAMSSHFEATHPGWAAAHTFTSEDGSFRLRGLPRQAGTLWVGNYALLETNFHDDAFCPIELSRVMPGGAPLRIILPVPPLLVGRIVPAPTVGSIRFVVKLQLGSVRQNWEFDPPLDEDGRFEVRFSRAGAPFDLLIDPGNGRPYYFEQIVLASGKTHDLGDLAVQLGGRTRGAVHDGRGVPLAGVSVHAWVDALWWEREALTNASGQYLIEHLPELAGQIEFSAEGHRAESFQFDNLGESRRLNVVLRQFGSLDAFVVDGAGRPCAYYDLVITSAAGPADAAVETFTDAEGRIQIELEPGRCSIRVRDPDSGADLAQAEVSIAADQTTSVTLRVE